MIIEEKENKILATKAFHNQHKKYSDIPKDLPQPPFSLLLCGPKGSGKSNLILNLVTNQNQKNYIVISLIKFIFSLLLGN